MSQAISATVKFADCENYNFRNNETTLVCHDFCCKTLQSSNYQVRDHRNFSAAQRLIETRGAHYFVQSLEDVERAIKALYGAQAVSLQQLAATFRRGDLISRLR